MPAVVGNEILVVDCPESPEKFAILCISSHKVNVSVKIDIAVMHIVRQYQWTYTNANGCIYGHHKVDGGPRKQLKYLIAEYFNPGCIVSRAITRSKYRVNEQIDLRINKIVVELAMELKEDHFEQEYNKILQDDAAKKLTKPEPKPINDDTECDPTENSD